MKAEGLVGKEIDGSLVCLGCIDKTLGNEAKLYAMVTRPIWRKDLKLCHWRECEVCGCPLELR